MAKQVAETNPSNLPTLDDFTESSLLSSAKEIKDAEAAKAGDDDAAAATGGDIVTGTGKAKPAKPAAAKPVDPAKPAKPADAGKPAEIQQLTPEALKVLQDKADTDISTLTEEEAQILIKAGYLEDENAVKETIWDDVAKINGIKLDVDFGTADPESAEGIALRDQVLMDHTVDNYLEYLKTNFPQSYKLLEHESKGGDINELFNVTAVDYSKIALKEADVDLQKQILTEFYKAKGFDEKRVTRMIEADEDSAEGLFAAAKEALTSQQAFQKQQEQAVIAQTQAKQEAIAARDEQVRGVIRSMAESGQIGNFSIADKKDRAEFYKFALSNVFSDGKEGYQVVLPVNDKTLVPVMQQLLFTYKNGDLTEFVKRTAATENVRKLKRKVAQDTSKAAGQEDNTQSTVKKLPTMDVFNA